MSAELSRVAARKRQQKNLFRSIEKKRRRIRDLISPGRTG
jgi:hypothetical protein